MVEKLKPDPPHIQALAALQADLPISGGVSEWLDKHRDQVVALTGEMGWGRAATISLGITPSSLVSWGVRRGLRTRKPREKKPKQKKARQVKPRQVKDPQVVRVSRDFKGIKLTLTVEFLEEGPRDSQRSSQRGE